MSYPKCQYEKEGICTFSLSLEQQFENEKHGIPLKFCDDFRCDYHPRHIIKKETKKTTSLEEYMMTHRSLEYLYKDGLIPNKFCTVVKKFGKKSLSDFNNIKLSDICELSMRNSKPFGYDKAYEFLLFCKEYDIIIEDDVFDKKLSSWSFKNIQPNGRKISFRIKNLPNNPKLYTNEELMEFIANAIYRSNDNFKITIEKI